ncbi:hypothetical protein [Metabacillus sp. B2-18]|uniref:hypothetical protein n=1 Tax=Metabacillus sp. B2-18 TaxID=2897333 RepID=UPI001E61A237|nr:hypothetical protein [Metabacillus sp. B2-18]UGB30708.1 hypothetical protein LPC09_23925 [Metabacillus sp. B2-18]
MFNIFRKRTTVVKKLNEESNKTKVDYKDKQKEDLPKIKLVTLLDLIKNGDEISLNIENEDAYEGDALLAKRRSLILDGLSIEFSEWAEWTVTINVHHDDKAFAVYSNDELKIDWDNETVEHARKHSYQDIEVEWTHEGEWCEYITSTVHDLKKKLDKHREDTIRQAKLEKERQYQLKVKKDNEQKEYFNQVYKNKK